MKTAHIVGLCTAVIFGALAGYVMSSDDPILKFVAVIPLFGTVGIFAYSLAKLVWDNWSN